MADQRKTGSTQRPFVQETADPAGKKPVAQWVVSGSHVRPASEALPEISRGAVPAPASGRPTWVMLVVAAAAGFAIAIPVTWYFFAATVR